jgi:hypothetical protein
MHIRRKDHDQTISDATNYDMLYIENYAHEFAYIPVSKRAGRSIDSDANYVRRVLDFPYHKQHDFTFDDPGSGAETKRTYGSEQKFNDLKRGLTNVVI